MNGRIKKEDTPEGRLAAVVESKNRQVRVRHERTGTGPTTLDYSDYKKTLAPWYRREELAARLDTARRLLVMTAAEAELHARWLEFELAAAVGALPDEYDL